MSDADGLRGRLVALPERWEEEASDWYYEHRHDTRGIDYAAGYEEGWGHAAWLLRAALGGGEVMGDA